MCRVVSYIRHYNLPLLPPPRWLCFCIGWFLCLSAELLKVVDECSWIF